LCIRDDNYAEEEEENVVTFSQMLEDLVDALKVPESSEDPPVPQIVSTLALPMPRQSLFALSSFQFISSFFFFLEEKFLKCSERFFFCLLWI
jgi:hypothetical protein